MARPSKYTPELADKICELISTTDRGLNSICVELDISPAIIYVWLKNNKEFLELYARAREAQADYLADQIIQIADDSSGDLKGVDEFGNRIENKEFVNRSRLRVDARKWIASKLKPKKYGEKLDTTLHVQKLGADLEDESYVD